MALQEQTWDQEPDLKAYDESGYLCGETGCGLCALYQLKQAGITHLKLVGRGNYVDHMEKISGICEKRWKFWTLQKMKQRFNV